MPVLTLRKLRSELIQAQDFHDAFEILERGLSEYFSKPILLVTSESIAHTKDETDSLNLPLSLPLSLQDRPVAYAQFGFLLSDQDRFLVEALLEFGTLTLERIQSRYEGILALSEAQDQKDQATGGHAKRVAQLACAVGRVMGLSRLQLEQLRLAALLHDLGKVGVEDRILRKNSALNSDEQKLMRRHPEAASEILGKLKGFDAVVAGILSHHERWDGQGYPVGQRGEEIPILGRIIAVTDGYDAMVSQRPYRKPLSHSGAIAEIKAQSGSQFDPRVVDAFLTLEHCVGTEGLLDFRSTHGLV